MNVVTININITVNTSAYFSELARCLRDSKDELPAIVEHFVDIEPNITVRNLIITTTCCGVLPLATMCKEKLCLSLQECPDHPGTLEVMNLMHSLLIKHYCANDASELMEVLRTTSVTCARQILRMITECWGKAGLDYNDITSVLRRLSRREKLCQQLVGTQKCVLEFFKTSEPCQGPLVDMIRNKTALVLAEFTCAKYGEEGKHLRDL
ncbi:uncharacterized protein LOC108677309 [Hyalella azteca]|uniref:Uncharacterized protein LOC108677309 n=1 Tax=Hyalella azteca TaxID=294128 RepID=A0A8B7P7A3_HYAAZ|nr:uncharacterized protein LOC108677309 [Hyalella azteca]